MNSNHSGNEVLLHEFIMLLVEKVTSKNSCSELHCQKGFNLIIFSYRIRNARTRTPNRNRRYPTSIRVLTSMAIRYKMMSSGDLVNKNEACSKWKTAE